jgi:iron complex outermembrane receptor protein
MTIPDALRLVPGMAVTHATGNDFRISYHGTSILSPRRMNVLIDGVSMYRPAFARVDWKELPVAIEDIDRIEVTRGPNSAAYGPNSMLAIVNIITRHAHDVERAMFSATLGSLDTAHLTGHFAASIGDTALRLTANREQDSGYDFVSRASDAHDSTRLNRLNLRSDTRIGAADNLSFHAAYVEGTKEVPFVDTFQRSFPDQRVRDYFIGATWTKSVAPTHELQFRANHSENRVRQDWVTCPPTATLLPELFALWQANPAYANTVLAGRVPSGGTANDNALAAAAIGAILALGPRAAQPTCTTPNQNLRQTRGDLELQDTYVFGERLRIVAGAGARQEGGESQTFLGGTVTTHSYRAFANAEYKPFEWLNLNAGGYVERDDLTGSSFSPRFAANVHVARGQTVRALVSKGTRTPDIQEQRSNWTYSANDANPPLNGSTSVRFYQSAISPGNLRSERIWSREVGYLLNVQRLGMLLDLKAFDDRLTDLIAEKLHVASFQPTNSGSVRLRGAELQVNVEPSETLTLFWTYAYLENRDASTPLSGTQYSRHSGAVGISQALGGGWRWSLAYYGASGDGVGESHYGREDFILGKTFGMQRSRLTASLIVRHLDNRTVTYFRDVGDTLQSRYDDSVQIFGQLRLSF